MGYGGSSYIHQLRGDSFPKRVKAKSYFFAAFFQKDSPRKKVKGFTL